MIDAATSRFEENRSHLLSIAYRMLGEMGAAEDTVQDAWLRWRGVDHDEIKDARAWLSAATVRLSLDALRSARVRRERYVGPWLPEPLMPDDMRILSADSPAAHAELASDLSMALLHVLERLSPEERAALILHDAFDCDYAVIAETLGKSEAACRKLVSRARDHVRADRPRHVATPDEHRDVLLKFAAAMQEKDPAKIASLFTPDAILYSDGGGRAAAALNPIYGAEKLARFLNGVMQKFGPSEGFAVEMIEVSGMPGLMLHDGTGLHSVLTLECGDDGRATALFLMRNPEKLARATRTGVRG